MKFKSSFTLILFAFYLFLFTIPHSALADEIQGGPVIPEETTAVMFDYKKEFDSKELIVQFASAATAAEKQIALAAIQGTEVSSLLGGEFSLVSVPKGTTLLEAADILLKNKAVELVQPNYEAERTFTPSDSGYKNQWYLKTIQMPKAWDVTKGSANITVAVIDGGLQVNHPDLKGKIVSPYNAVTGGTTFAADPHGTHVAGTIAASINNAGVAGIVPNSKIMPINVFQGSRADMYHVAEAIVYAADKGANVINLSLGTYYYSAVVDYAVSYANQKGVVIVASAGNEDTSAYSYPAALPSVIAVSATDRNNQITNFSNYGYYIDIAAPGLDIYSTMPGSSYNYMTGTSMSAPIVSGIAAAVLSKNPLLNAAQVDSILTKSAVDVGQKGWDAFYGHGRVDAYKALQQTALPISNITASAAFAASGANKTYFSFTAQKGSTVSVTIQNSKGTVIKKLINPKTWNGGKLSASWDGKQDSGLYAPSASYTIVAKLTNGKESVYKKSTVKLTNKVKPTIKMATSAQFSPTAGKLAVSYELNQTTTISAKVYDSKNALVKTLLSNKSVSAKTNKVEWNGTNSKNQKVKDGSYKLVVSGTGTNKIQASNAAMTIKTDNVKPTAQLTLLASPFKMDGQSKPAVKATFKEKVSVSTIVMTDKGIKVKQLTTKQAYNAGTVTLKWDGKNDKGKFAAEGNYLYQMEVKDAAGNILVAKSKVFSLQDWQKPVIQSNKDLLYNKAGNASFSYTLNKPAAVTIQILNNGKTARTIESAVSKKTGANTFIWNGKDQAGNVLPDGSYQYKITAVDKYKTSVSFTGNIKVALTSVKITFPTVVPFYGPDYGSDVYYELSHDSTVTVEILDSTNVKIRTVEQAARKSGLNHFNWDGLNDNGDYAYWDDEFYYYVIKAKNAAGSVTSVMGKISNMEEPDWLSSHFYSFIPSDLYPWENKELELSIDLKKPVTMQLYVYESAYSDMLLDQANYRLTAGINDITYTKKTTANSYYVISYTDPLGNEYIYGIDESDFLAFSTQKTPAVPELVLPRE